MPPLSCVFDDEDLDLPDLPSPPSSAPRRKPAKAKVPPREPTPDPPAPPSLAPLPPAPPADTAVAAFVAGIVPALTPSGAAALLGSGLTMAHLRVARGSELSLNRLIKSLRLSPSDDVALSAALDHMA